MYKKGAVALACLTLAACSIDRGTENWDNTGEDWALNCERNASETAKDYDACVAEAERAGRTVISSRDGGRPVEHTPHGYRTRQFNVKEHEPRERSQDN